MDKAPDAFRTISEVADDLDIPQHVLRFWETRFSQIKPMKRSGGRRYYRPDDVDLLRGIRRLLYGEGYTIRGVQRILKENGIKAVQGLVGSAAAPGLAPGLAPARTERVRTEPMLRAPDAPEPDDAAEVDDDDAELADDAEVEADDSDADDEEAQDDEQNNEEEDDQPDDAAAEPAPSRGAPAAIARPLGESRANFVARPAEPAPRPQPIAAPRPLERERLEAVLGELLTVRQLLDAAMKDG